MRSRWFVATGLTFALIGSVALADPLPDVAGTYNLTGTEGNHPTRVTLVVSDAGSVKRSVTYTDDGSQHEYSGTGALTGKTLVVDFPVSTGNAPTPTPADPSNLGGVWKVRGRNGVGAYGGTATISKTPSGEWQAVFRYAYDNAANGTGSAVITGTLNGNGFVGKRLRTTGLIGGLIGNSNRKPVGCRFTLSADGLKLDGTYSSSAFPETFTRSELPSGNGSSNAPKARATYTFDGAGGVSGTVANPSGAGGFTSASESGTKDDPSALKVVSPASGAVLVGQVLDVTVSPSTATFEVVAGSPARKAANGKLQITGKGEVSIVAKQGDRSSDPVKLKAIGLEVVELTVEKAQPILDAPAPHSKRAFGSQDKGKETPAAILVNEKLTVSAKVQGSDDLAAPVKAKLVAEGNGVKLASEQVDLSAVKAGQSVTLVSEAPLNAKIDINVLELTLKLETEAGVADAGSPAMALRVYTMFKPTIRNGPYYGEQERDIPTKSHLDLACQWAKGTSKNVGNGNDSICWKLDNYVRHHVHPQDFKAGREPYAPAYQKGSTPPINYADLPGAWQAKSSGERGVGQIYYPPLEVRDANKEDYSHYASNFGWWVLDNPTHTGGRCNQQASLMCDLFGTMGIKAQVHYLQRVGRGKSTGRPVRQYFNSGAGDQYWNFHGLAKAQLEDGSWWLYDGSFSFAPDRKNGRLEWAEAPGRWLNQDTPFIYEFGPWYYEDWMGGLVPVNDIPDKHVDGSNPGRGEFSGVPKAATEDLGWYNKKPPAH